MMLIGCQGWNYADWITAAAGETVFYPRGTRAGEMLELYARVFQTVEIDSTFYAVPSKVTLESWKQKTPDELRFSLKLPQSVSHENLLRAGGFAVLHEFCANVRALGDKLAAVLVQLPPQFVANQENTAVLQNFLRELPTDIRFAVEFRERGWFDQNIFELLAKHRVALCLTEGNWIPRAITFQAVSEAIADFVYVRFMGERDLTEFDRVQRRQTANLESWRETLQLIQNHTTDALVYFSNFYEGFAPASANKFKQLCGQQTVAPESLETQSSLF